MKEEKTKSTNNVNALLYGYDKDGNVSNEWMTGTEVKEFLNISTRTLQEYRTTGKIGYSQINKKKIHYCRLSIMHLLASNYVAPKTQNA